MNRPAFTIAAVERDTGVAKDTLRVWERRYGFPTPERDGNGERLYPADQVDKLRLIKRLMDQGFRPGRLMAAADEELADIVSSAPQARVATPTGDNLQMAILAVLKANDARALRGALNQAMHRQGLQNFVLETVGLLNCAVGEAWMRGELEVFEEHLYTEQMQALLRQAISALPASGGLPRVVLTTVPDEQHVLGLLMSEALLALEGASCVSLGTQTPIADIGMAASAHQADIVALSFSSAFPQRQVTPLLTQLRTLLPAHIRLWAGGSGVARCTPPGDTALLHTLPDLLAALSAWRTSNTDKAAEQTR
ncbi:MAG: MerR family transcriptional regulator [Betaproteobacteria bacterium]|nr:MerR family transcriptional regulator [Betaproteobacteria bacterium]